MKTIKLKIKNKRIIEINLVSLAFIALSFMSITLAWFAYSGLSDVTADVGVRAWFIEFDKDGNPISNDYTISKSDMQPGMETFSDRILIKNKGDADASVQYSIVNARILDQNYTVGESLSSHELEDMLAHDFPFHININLTQGFVMAGESTQDAEFSISISWPLDSENNYTDGYWGTRAYEFNKQEQAQHEQDESYNPRSAIEIALAIEAEQYIQEEKTADYNYPLGKTVRVNVNTGEPCDESLVNTYCVNTIVLDTRNTLGDTYFTAMPIPTEGSVFTQYPTGTYDQISSVLNGSSYAAFAMQMGQKQGPLTSKHVLEAVSTDVKQTMVDRSNVEFSDKILGNLTYTDSVMYSGSAYNNGRYAAEAQRIIDYNGFVKYSNDKFPYFYLTDGCMWTGTSYNASNAWAIERIDLEQSMIGPKLKNSVCRIVPLLSVRKG